MSRRESRDSQGKRLHSRSEREISPKRTRRDGKPATERTNSSNLNQEIVEPAGQEQRHRRRLQDALPLEVPPATESKVQPDVVNKQIDKKDDELSNGAIRSSDPNEKPRSRSYFQHDERNIAGQGGRSLGRRFSDNRRRSDQEEQLGDKVRDKNAVLHKKHEGTQPQVGDRNLWRHDGFFELEAEAPPARRRPAFREKKMPAEDVGAGTTESESVKPPCHDQPEFGTTTSRREERGGGYVPRRPDKPEKAVLAKDERNLRRGDWSSQRTEMQRAGFQSRDRFGTSRSARGRDRPDGRYGEREPYRPGDIQVEKWKHDLFDEANRSPTPKNEEDQIAKVEALLAL